jgi:recombination protein RecA
VEKSLEKQYEGTKVLQKWGEKVGQKLPSIPTNLPTLDHYVLGCGGIPKGRIIEIYGAESSGKTTLALHVIGQCQKAGQIAAFIDAEHTLDPTYASKIGVNMDELLVSQPDYGEQALEIAEALIDSDAVDLIVIDSVSALVPKAELDGEMGDSHMGLQARLMSQAMRKLAGKCSKKNVAVIFINQIREKVGLVFGNPEVTTGGRALKFAASTRLEVRKVAGQDGFLKDDKTIIGHRMKVKAVKNKAGCPFRDTEIHLYYATGFDTKENLFDYAVQVGVVKNGAWCELNGEKLRKYDLLSNEHIGKLVKAVAEYEENRAKLAQPEEK